MTGTVSAAEAVSVQECEPKQQQNTQTGSPTQLAEPLFFVDFFLKMGYNV